jgi:hypothetical protein
MMHSGDWPNSISERDLRVTASQQFFADLDAREATRGEVTFDDFKTFLHDPFSREQVAERMKFLAAFANGDDVWRYSARNYRGKSVPHWERVDFFDMHAEPRFLSLVWRDDEPAATE